MHSFSAFIHAPNFVTYAEQLGYLGVFVWFTVFDFVAPFPDEVSLLTVGYLASLGYFNPFIVAAVPFASFLLTDSISFFLSRKGRTLLHLGGARRHARRGTFRAFVAHNLEKNLPGTIIAACFIPRMRVWGPIVSGSLRVRFRRFISFDAIGVALFVALYVNLGYFFGVSLSAVFDHLEAMKASIFVGILLVLGIALLFITHKAGEWRSHE